MRLRWRRQPSERGLARVCQGWRGWELRSGVNRLALVAAENDRHPPTRFYWYGMDRNTLRLGITFADPEAAKVDALDYARKFLAAQKEMAV